MATEPQFEIKVEEARFWFVWTKAGRVPRFLHGSAASAEAEAERLARLHPGRKFIVLTAGKKISARTAEAPAEAEVA